MNSVISSNIVRFFVLILIQVLICNHINFLGYINPYIYILFVILFPVKNNRSALDLDTLLNYVGIPEEPKPHIAMNGCISHAEVLSRLLYDKKLLPEFEQFDIPWKK